MKLPRYPRPILLLLILYAGFSADAPAGSRGGSPVSAHISAAILADLPAYAPPAPSATAAPAPGGTEGIIFLPKVIVHGSKFAGSGGWDMLTPKGQKEFLKKLYPGMVVPGPDPLTETRPNYASQMRRDDQRIENLQRLGDAVDLYRVTGDVKGSKQLKEEMQRALIRGYDWRTERLDRSYNNDRRGN